MGEFEKELNSPIVVKIANFLYLGGAFFFIFALVGLVFAHVKIKRAIGWLRKK